MGFDIEELAELKRDKKIEYLHNILKEDDDFFKKVVLLMAMREDEAEKVLTIISEYRSKEWELIKKLKNNEGIEIKEYLVMENENAEIGKETKLETAETMEKIEEVQKEIETKDMIIKSEESVFLKLMKVLKEKFKK